MKLAQVSEAELPTVAAGMFKAKCLGLMDKSVADQRPFLITKRGKPLGRFVPEPLEEKPFRTSVGLFPQITILGDVVSAPPQEWTLPEWAWEQKGKAAEPGKKAKKKK